MTIRPAFRRSSVVMYCFHPLSVVVVYVLYDDKRDIVLRRATSFFRLIDTL